MKRKGYNPSPFPVHLMPSCVECPGSCAVIPNTHDCHYSAAQLQVAQRLQGMTGLGMDFDPQGARIVPRCSQAILGHSEFDEAVARLNLLKVIRGQEGCRERKIDAINA